jgi:hypothetical protein
LASVQSNGLPIVAKRSKGLHIVWSDGLHVPRFGLVGNEIDERAGTHDDVLSNRTGGRIKGDVASPQSRKIR